MKTQNQIERACPGASPWSALLKIAFLTTTALAFAACESESGPGPGTNPHGNCEEDGTCPPTSDKKASGEECTTSAECESGLCTTLTATSNIAFCFDRCSSQSDCANTEEPTSCTSITNRQGQFTQACVATDFCHDLDADGYGEGPGCSGFDCDDNNPNVYPGAEEYCDGADNNCNGVVDESPVDTNTACDTGYPGECADGRWACVLGQRLCTALILPDQKRELCDGRDNDCDDKVDEGPDGFDTNFIAGLGQACGSGVDTCFAGTTVCDPVTRVISCDGERETTDVRDICDYIDNNCDGQIDEDVRADHPDFGTPCTKGIGTCRATGIVACVTDDPYAAPACNAVANSANSVPETCDYNDNDCDGEVDEDFVNSNGVYNTAAHCGSCNNDCANILPDAVGVIRTCNVGPTSATCGTTCQPGRFDINGVARDGCEFTPDPDAVYVAMPTNGARPGTDNNSCGSWSAPCATIAYAITRSQEMEPKRHVIRLSEGIFAGGFDLVNGISILGGHSARDWTRNKLEDGGWANNTTLQGGKTSGNDAYAIKANNINQNTVISGLTIEAPDAAGPSGNSIGIWVVNSNQNLQIIENTILGGRGGQGAAGSAGTNGASGQAGSNGADRRNNQSSFSSLNGGVAGTGACSGTNVSGGQGANVTRSPANSTDADDARAINNDGGQAANGAGSSGNYGKGGDSMWHFTPSGESGGIHACNINDGPASPTPGTDGRIGEDGNGGNGASNANGNVSSGMWRGAAGSQGAAGTPGRGGGGGGSSGGIRDRDRNNAEEYYHYGPTGGGGGAGGCGGGGATGGQAGGASFGIFATFSSTPSAGTRPVIADNTITRGQGGRGGQGGLGGVGGSGGLGGLGGVHEAVPGNWSRCGQNAAQGGNGGRGGHGGGGGGAGGVSYDIAVGGSVNNSLDAYQGANNYTEPNGTLTGGQGGAGGSAIENPGSAGARGASGNFRRF